MLDSDNGDGVGYLLKDRVGAVVEFNTTVEQVSAGHTLIDPEVVRQLISRRPDPRQRLTTRDLEVPALMAQGRSNGTIGKLLHVTDAAVNKHSGNIFSKLDLPTTTDGHRRVLAVLAYLRS